VFEDTYYDRDDALSKQGVYVRRRRYFDTDGNYVNVNVKPASSSAKSSKEVNKAEKPAKQENWEAKIRIAGNFTRSAFQELHGFDAVARLVRERLPARLFHDQHHRNNHQCGQHRHLRNDHYHRTPTSKVVGDDDGTGTLSFPFLDVLARFVTYRRQWLVNERFHVVIDEADFGHVVGEVELAQESERTGPPEGPGGHESHREDVCKLETEVEAEKIGWSEGGDEGQADKELAEELDQEIEAFMERYAWAFPRGEVKGKLSAYFAGRSQSAGSG